MTDKPTPEAWQAAVALRERIASLREPFDPDEETARDFDAFAARKVAEALSSEAVAYHITDKPTQAALEAAIKLRGAFRPQGWAEADLDYEIAKEEWDIQLNIDALALDAFAAQALDRALKKVAQWNQIRAISNGE